MSVTTRLTGAALSLLLASSSAAAEPEAPTLPADPLLAELIQQALAARPELAQAQETLRAERQRAPQVSALPDPTLQIGVQNDSFTSWEVGKMETSFFSIMASETFPWPGKQGLRSDVAGLGAKQTEQSVARLRLSTEAEVRRAYLNLLLARDRLSLLDQLESVWKKSATLARTRYETGQGAQSDVLRAQLELNRINGRRWSLQADATNELETLNRLRGKSLDEPLTTSVHVVDLPLPALDEDTAATQESALERSPELAAARLAVKQNEASVGLARSTWLPDISVTAGIMPRGGPFPVMWLLNVGGTLPVFAGSKQERAIEEAQARATAASRSVEGVEQVIALRTAQRRNALSVALRTARLYRDGLLVQSEATANSTLAQYQVGKVTFASVLEANAGLIGDRDSYLQTLAQVHRLRIDEAEVNLGPVATTSAGAGASAMPGAGAIATTSTSQSTGTAAASSGGGAPTSMSGM